ncbi:hypothetical protein GIY56_15440 [Paracoccus sp. YIM 132242]|uniref:Uncharacterized protein n=1 Tax=Paracoccus lichenicola TaxID=2665644 RepID=A0A6L6HTU2_9RHOB|nr:hypothetical protein [Paracoccus lichenicola]MTE01682.1 hypothetical protein [Paracoccus lichenicola]
MAMFRYDPPGNIDDLAGRPTRKDFLEAWDRWIGRLIKEEIDALGMLGKPDPSYPDDYVDDYVPHPLFFSEADHPAQNTGIPVFWNAFPLSVLRAYGSDREGSWRHLDKLRSHEIYSPNKETRVRTAFRPQDEYCEWHWYKDGPKGPRIVFTAEGPEYWVKLAHYDMDRVVELYQERVSPDVRREDLLLETELRYVTGLLEPGTYNPFNIWNTERGVMHLTQRANTLGAEINLAARATVLRRDASGKRITDSRRLICSSGYGDPNRSSDPNIGYNVNMAAVPPGATKPMSITLANPVGLYMDDIDPRLTDDKGEPLIGWFQFVRGHRGKGLMAVLEPPDGDKRTLEDVRVDGEKLVSGAQVAGLIQMVLYAATADLGAPMPPMDKPVYRACVKKGTDLTNLKNENIDELPRVEQTCEAVSLDEAFPELFERPAPLVAEGGAARSTRNA